MTTRSPTYDPLAALAYIRQQTWAILPAALTVLVERIRAGELAAAAMPAVVAALPRNLSRQTGAIAVVPLMGYIHQRPDPLEEWLGISFGTSTEALAATLRKLAASSEIKAIVLDVDSPGGTVAGVAELADEMFALRQQKPIVAVANSLAASAAYWIASQATELVVVPSAIVGSIGVLTVHEDLTGMAEQMGVKITLISAGKYKTVGSQFEPLTDEGKALAQGLVDEQYGQFVAAVARGRGVTPAAVKAGFGQGFVVGAKDAVAEGMADRAGTLRETLIRLGATEEGARGAAGEPLATSPTSTPTLAVELELAAARLELRERGRVRIEVALLAAFLGERA